MTWYDLITAVIIVACLAGTVRLEMAQGPRP
jgi:hypothetical protein